MPANCGDEVDERGCGNVKPLAADEAAAAIMAAGVYPLRVPVTFPETVPAKVESGLASADAMPSEMDSPALKTSAEDWAWI
jgi:hypothetical protein